MFSKTENLICAESRESCLWDLRHFWENHALISTSLWLFFPLWGWGLLFVVLPNWILLKKTAYHPKTGKIQRILLGSAWALMWRISYISVEIYSNYVRQTGCIGIKSRLAYYSSYFYLFLVSTYEIIDARMKCFHKVPMGCAEQCTCRNHLPPYKFKPRDESSCECI